MNRKHLSIVAAGLVALFASCSDNVVEAGDQAIETSANLKVEVRDYSNNALISGAKVALLSGGNQETTNAQGVAIIKGVPYGTNGLRVDKEGYASLISSASLASTGSDGVFIVRDGVAQVQLYPLSASLSGVATHNGVPVPAGGKVRLVFTNASIEKTEYEVEITAGGKYSFENLPATGNNATLRLRILTGDKLYEVASISSPALYSGSPATLALETANQIRFYLASYSSELDELTDNVEFNFNAEVDTKNKSNRVSVSSFNQSFNQYDLEWDAEGKKLTLKLFPGSEWPAESFNVSLLLYSKEGKEGSEGNKATNSGSIYYPVEYPVAVKQKALASVEGIKWTGPVIGESSNLTINISWEGNGDDYYIYAKASKSATKSDKFTYIGRTVGPSSSYSNSSGNLAGLLDLTSENFGVEYYNTDNYYETYVPQEYCGSKSSKGFYSVYGGSYTSSTLNSTGSIYGVDSYLYYPIASDNPIYNSSGDLISRYSKTTGYCTQEDIDNGYNNCSTVDDEYYVMTLCNNSLVCSDAYIKEGTVALNAYYYHIGDYNNGYALYGTQLPTNNTGTIKAWFTDDCDESYKIYGKKQDKITAPFAGDGKVEIVVQAVRGAERNPVDLSTATEAKNKITLKKAQ